MGKYLFFYLKTGSGHLAPAKAISEMIGARYKGKVEIQLVDGLSEAKAFLRIIIEDGYKTAVNKAVWTYEFLYALHKIKAVSRLTAFIVSYFVMPGIEKYILDNKPEKIVIFHFFLIKPVYSVIKKHNLDISVITVVTDPFTAHPIWFLQNGQKYIVFSEILRDNCIDMGIDSNDLEVFPFVLDGKFSKTASESKKLKIRRQLGFELGTKIILIMGGGEGMPHGKKILKNIITKNMDAEIAFVCGRNKKLYEKAVRLQEKHGIKNLKVYGYIDFVYSLINISDVVITKCGASTFMEILLMGKVPVINTYIWEQEKGNMEFVCKREMGVLEKNIKSLPRLLQILLTDNELYNSFCNNIRKASIKNGVGQVADYIINYQ